MRPLSFALLLICVTAQAGPPQLEEGTTQFRLESKAAVDDVFGDSSEYRRTIDRFLELVQKMQSMRDEFARSVQMILQEIGARPGSSPRKIARICPTQEISQPYSRAQFLGAEYLRVGRELTRHHDQIREYDRLGESIGLTPDYRWKVKRVLQQFGALLTDYREMKVAFHDQLNQELVHMRCDLDALASRGDGRLPLESWPQPGAPGAPGVKVDAKPEPHEDPPPTLPVEKVPVPQPIAVPKRPEKQLNPGTDNPNQARYGVLFYVDNSKCARTSVLHLDGRRMGEVAPGTRQGFQTSAGPHDLCLLTDTKLACGSPGTVRRGYIHEGWTISLRCE